MRDKPNYWTAKLSRRQILARGGLVAAGLAAVPLVGCGGGSSSSTTSTPSGGAQTASATGSQQAVKTAKIGMLFPLTGAAGGYGSETAEGFKFEFNRANKKGGIETAGGFKVMLDPVLVDTESSPDVAPTKAEDLANQDLLVATGAIQSATVLLIAQVMARHNIPFVSSTDSVPQLTTSGFTQTFRVGPIPKVAASFPVQGMYDIGTKAGKPPKKVAILQQGGPGGKDYGDGMQAKIQSLGLTLFDYVTYPLNTQDFTTQLLRFKDNNVDTLFSHALAPDAIKVIQGMKQVDYNPYAIGGPGGGYNDPGFIPTVGKDGNYVFNSSFFLPDEKLPGKDQIVADWKATYNKDMPTVASLGISGAAVIIDAISRMTAYSRDAFVTAMRNTDLKEGQKDFLLLGGCKFDSTGANVNPKHALWQYQSEKTVTVWPFNVASVDAIWPRPKWGTF